MEKELPMFFGPLAATFVLIASTIILFIWYSLKKQRYWKERGIPSADTVPILGSIRAMMKKPLYKIELERYQKYGPLYGYYEGNRPVLSVGDPKLIRSILVKDFHIFPGARRLFDPEDIKDISKYMVSLLRGEDWKRIRSILSPTFTTGKLKRVAGIFKQCAAALTENFRELASKDESVNMKSLYGAFTMDVIASSAFSTKINSHKDPNNEFVQNAKKAFMFGFNWKFLFMLLWPRLIKYIKLEFFPQKVLEFFTKVTHEIIEERKKTQKTHNDFLQLLLDTAREVEAGNVEKTENEKEDIASNYGNIDGDQVIRNITIKKSLSFEEVVAQCVIFFVAGYETTASTLAFTSYLLADNPDIQEKLIAEVDEVLSSTNGELTYQAVQSMKYLDNVIAETLRLYPPLPKMERQAVSDYKLGDTGITIFKDMVVSIPIFAIHRDPKIYPDPEKFDPDRFNPEERAKRDQFAYIPFSGGPRNCVAMRFALLEIKFCLAYVLSHFRFRKSEDTKAPLRSDIAQFLLQPDVSLKVELRKDAIEAH